MQRAGKSLVSNFFTPYKNNFDKKNHIKFELVIVISEKNQ